MTRCKQRWSFSRRWGGSTRRARPCFGGGWNPKRLTPVQKAVSCPPHPGDKAARAKNRVSENLVQLWVPTPPRQGGNFLYSILRQEKHAGLTELSGAKPWPSTAWVHGALYNNPIQPCTHLVYSVQQLKNRLKNIFLLPCQVPPITHVTWKLSGEDTKI